LRIHDTTLDFTTMSFSSLFDVRKQLTFYGSYHSHPVNVGVHMFGVPLLQWSLLVLASILPVPSFVPRIHYVFNDYLVFNLNVPAMTMVLYFVYYTILEPVAAIIYAPQLVIILLTATAFSEHSGSIQKAAILNVISWIAQFIGHGVAEKRSPALLDNILGAFVLAPFFVHLEILFSFGYNPELHKQLQNDVGKEILKIKTAEGGKRRAAEKRS